tara:strand:- start:53 stop:340 length:288 start_codon:yes stop_codon:yes gene_type:complete
VDPLVLVTVLGLGLTSVGLDLLVVQQHQRLVWKLLAKWHKPLANLVSLKCLVWVLTPAAFLKVRQNLVFKDVTPEVVKVVAELPLTVGPLNPDLL